ncbi:MAG: RNA polymerase sigma factor [Planctomycetes bacterium]|nr:RNA polymerase sigma factor [Planctomycetota bacterium]
MEPSLNRFPTDPEEARRAFEASREPLYRFLFGMLGSREEAEDMVQETWLTAHREAARFRGDSVLLTWLTGIALNHARRRLRRRRLERWLTLDFELFSPDAAPEAEAIRREDAEQVRAAVAALPDREREVLTMFDWEGLSHAEIARLLGCAEGTIWSLLSRARSNVRRRLERGR